MARNCDNCGNLRQNHECPVHMDNKCSDPYGAWIAKEADMEKSCIACKYGGSDLTEQPCESCMKLNREDGKMFGKWEPKETEIETKPESKKMDICDECKHQDTDVCDDCKTLTGTCTCSTDPMPPCSWCEGAGSKFEETNTNLIKEEAMDTNYQVKVFARDEKKVITACLSVGAVIEDKVCHVKHDPIGVESIDVIADSVQDARDIINLDYSDAIRAIKACGKVEYEICPFPG